MNISGLILLGAGYLLGNPQARENFGNMVQGIVGQGIDALNKMNVNPHNFLASPIDGGDANVEQEE